VKLISLSIACQWLRQHRAAVSASSFHNFSRSCIVHCGEGLRSEPRFDPHGSLIRIALYKETGAATETGVGTGAGSRLSAPLLCTPKQKT
jgi:hypothetical protein